MAPACDGDAVTTRIKFCGITRIEDALAAADLAIDAIGLVFTQRSRRHVDIAQANLIRRVLPPFVSVVALFMDDEAGWIDEVIANVQPDLLQFHGDESAAFAARFPRPYLKAVPMGSIADVPAFAAAYPEAAGFLLDSHSAGTPGGSGEMFDWKRMPRNVGRPLILAGGLEASNVAQAVTLVRPYAVDVSSGIEVSPGIKDASRMRHFVDAVRAADFGVVTPLSPAGRGAKPTAPPDWPGP
jgi:phosphoribosylanthranilate isomerase